MFKLIIILLVILVGIIFLVGVLSGRGGKRIKNSGHYDQSSYIHTSTNSNDHCSNDHSIGPSGGDSCGGGDGGGGGGD